jgi:diguanylate cyclase (GGDEF)-like protein
MTTTIKTWRQKLAAVLEWSPVDKGQILLLMLVPILGQYMLWNAWVLGRPDRDQLVDVAAMHRLQQIENVMLGGALLLILLGLFLRRRRPDALWFQHLAVQYYAIVLPLLGYSIGLNAISTGIVLIGAPIFGFIVMDRRVIWLATGTAVALVLSLSIATAEGLLPYAPALQPATSAAVMRFQTYGVLGFAAPHFIFILLLADQTLHSWRAREDTIRALSRTDMLTGIANRRAIMELLDKEVARTQRHGPPFALVILDLDHFKRINDTWGHPTGDKVLQQTAAVLGGCIRQCDVVGRYGGEEFMILLPETTLEGARITIERCRARLADTLITTGSGETIRVSASFGLVSNEANFSLAADALIKLADEALYRAKHGGRNRIEAVRAAAA